MRKRIKNSLTIKIFLLTVCMLLLISGVTYSTVAWFLPATYAEEVETALKEEITQLLEELKKKDSVEEIFSVISYFEKMNQTSVAVMDEDGEFVYSGIVISEDTEDTTILSNNYVAQEIGQAEILQEGQTVIMDYPLHIKDITYTLYISGPGAVVVEQTLDTLLRILPYTIVIALVLSVICAFLSSRYLTRPILEISRISKKMAALSFSEKCKDNRGDEVGSLAKDLNELSANLSGALHGLHTAHQRLKSDIEKERETEKKRNAFFAAASHELKTPLTILKGHLGGMLQNVGAYQNRDYYLGRSLTVTSSMEEMVQEILLISRMETEEAGIQKGRTDLAELLRVQMAEFVEIMEEKNMNYSVEVPEHLYGNVNESNMTKVFRNLCINALRYSPEGEQIRVYMERSEGKIYCAVENTGVQIPEESIFRLFEAFYRVEVSRNRETGGTGLGLYLVRTILEQHNATYGAENISDGVRFWFCLSE